MEAIVDMIWRER